MTGVGSSQLKAKESSASEKDSKNPKPTEEKEPICPAVLINKGYRLGAEIGSGVFAKVYKGYNEKEPNKEYAFKRMDINSLPSKWRDRSMNLELKVLKKLSHPYIIKTHDLFKTRSTIFILMDYCPNGSIHKKLQDQKKPFSELMAKIWFSQILGALSYCHSKGVAHRDIKLDNFLLNSDEDAVLTDFGFSTLGNTKNADIMRDTSCGHPAYMAPEVFDETKIWPYDAKAADMYSMGVCLFEMLNFDKPFDPSLAVDNQLKHVMKQRKREYKLHSPVANKLSKHIKELVDQLLDPNPSTRITSEQTLIHSGIIPYLE